MSARELYRHRQVGWTMILSAAVPVLVLAFLLPHANPKAVGSATALIQHVWVVPAIVVGLVALLFSSLRVTVTTETLEVSFGPGLVRKRFLIADIEKAEITRTNVATGWGIRMRRDATVYNVSGFDAVLVTFKARRSIIIGSDDASHLKHVIEGACARR